jgi:hypothetical protein
MNQPDELSEEEASRQATTAVASDLEFWARRVAVRGQLNLSDLVAVLDALRAESVPEQAEPPALSTLTAS